MVSNFGTFYACMRDDGDGAEFLDLVTTSSTINCTRETAVWQEKPTTKPNPGRRYWDIHPVTRVVKIEIRLTA